MAIATVARYTGSTIELTLAVGLLGIATVHTIAGVPTALLPAIGAFGLIGGAVALAPVTRRRIRQNATGREDILVFLGSLIVATATLGSFVVLGQFF
ncbi:hypothetical protein [Natrarchaeobius chitinivorans]|uniref:Uncharacterized protein n=1 Tax=Natrarchaeobius chitinivorans TaxID=1679083 RepID=A0A3N6MJ91_NATCH|nr:hypothetical protein [Natrarchaeobius chitinivorans]RQG94206.1 hypothetical protein EA473_12585 [Natrarchaeobius chitinivorans]